MADGSRSSQMQRIISYIQIIFRRRKNIAGAMLLVLLAALSTGCGSGSSESTTASAEAAASSKRQFISEAEAACKKANAEQEVLLGKVLKHRAGKGPITPAEQSLLVRDAAAPPLEQEAKSIAELSAPAQEKEKVTAFVDAVETAAQQIQEEPAALLEGTSTAFRKAEGLAQELHLEGCGSP